MKTEELLKQPEIQKSLIAVMEYLEEILAERKLLLNADSTQQKADFSKIDMSATITAADASTCNTHIRQRL